MNVAALFYKMIVLFVAMAAGFIAAKCGLMDKETNRRLSILVVNLTNPFQILSSVCSGEHPLTGREVLLLTVIAALSYAVLIALSFPFSAALRLNRDDRSLFRFMLIFSNIGHFGYPLAEALFGPSGMFFITPFVLFFQLVCWSYGLNLIGGDGKFHFTLKMFLHPGIISAILAYIIYLSDVAVPKLAAEAVSFVGGLTPALSMLIIGCSLASLSFRTLFSQWRIYILAFVKMVLLPALAFLLLRNLISNEAILGVTLLVLLAPVASNTTMICYQSNANDELASSGVFLTTILAVVTMPLMMSLFFG